MSMNQAKTLNIRLNPEKEIDKKIMEYFDKSMVPKTTFVKAALIHEIERLEIQGDPYARRSIDKPVVDYNDEQEVFQNKERLKGGFNAFSDKDI